MMNLRDLIFNTQDESVLESEHEQIEEQVNSSIRRRKIRRVMHRATRELDLSTKPKISKFKLDRMCPEMQYYLESKATYLTDEKEYIFFPQHSHRGPLYASVLKKLLEDMWDQWVRADDEQFAALVGLDYMIDMGSIELEDVILLSNMIVSSPDLSNSRKRDLFRSHFVPICVRKLVMAKNIAAQEILLCHFVEIYLKLGDYIQDAIELLSTRLSDIAVANSLKANYYLSLLYCLQLIKYNHILLTKASSPLSVGSSAILDWTTQLSPESDGLAIVPYIAPSLTEIIVNPLLFAVVIRMLWKYADSDVQSTTTDEIYPAIVRSMLMNCKVAMQNAITLAKSHGGMLESSLPAMFHGLDVRALYIAYLVGIDTKSAAVTALNQYIDECTVGNVDYTHLHRLKLRFMSLFSKSNRFILSKVFEDTFNVWISNVESSIDSGYCAMIAYRLQSISQHVLLNHLMNYVERSGCNTRCSEWSWAVWRTIASIVGPIPLFEQCGDALKGREWWLQTIFSPVMLGKNRDVVEISAAVTLLSSISKECGVSLVGIGPNLSDSVDTLYEGMFGWCLVPDVVTIGYDDPAFLSSLFSDNIFDRTRVPNIPRTSVSSSERVMSNLSYSFSQDYNFPTLSQVSAIDSPAANINDWSEIHVQKDLHRCGLIKAVEVNSTVVQPAHVVLVQELVRVLGGGESMSPLLCRCLRDTDICPFENEEMLSYKITAGPPARKFRSSNVFITSNKRYRDKRLNKFLHSGDGKNPSVPTRYFSKKFLEILTFQIIVCLHMNECKVNHPFILRGIQVLFQHGNRALECIGLLMRFCVDIMRAVQIINGSRSC